MLYSLVLDFKDGTYLSQGHGNTPMEGLFRCIYHLNPIEGLDSDTLIEELENEEAIEIDGLENIWCFAASVGSEFIIIHLVATIG